MIPVIVIFAPTACGKTALALDLFGSGSLSCFKGCAELISADSQAVYKYFDIGTAKPSVEERSQFPHYLIDVCEPDVQFGLGDFMSQADLLCSEIHKRNKIPLVLGGTGFYIRNFLLGAPVTPESSPEIRSQLKQRISFEGKEALYKELCSIDELSARKINPNDEYRILRALEVFYISGKPLSSFKLPDSLRKEYKFCPIILDREREELYNRIDLRVDMMFEEGLENEIQKLISMGYNENTPAMKAIGYSEWFLPGLSVDEIKQKIKFNSHRYAKKQETFMRGIPGASIVHADDYKTVTEIVNCFLESL